MDADPPKHKFILMSKSSVRPECPAPTEKLMKLVETHLFPTSFLNLLVPVFRPVFHLKPISDSRTG